MPCSDHAVLLKATAQHGRFSTLMVLFEPKHVGAAFIILTILIVKEFYNLCASV
jgi:hypothetical protein